LSILISKAFRAVLTFIYSGTKLVILYTILENKHKVLPVKVVEQVVTKTLEGETIKYTLELPNSKKTNISIEKLYKEFEGIFDPAGYGLYLDGFDRNKIFKQKSINKNLFISKSAINLKNSFIKFKKIKNYKIPFLNYKNKQVKLLTLHIHSKNLKKFLSK